VTGLWAYKEQLARLERGFLPEGTARENMGRQDPTSIHKVRLELSRLAETMQIPWQA